MAMSKYIKVTHNGDTSTTDVGALYLQDIGVRPQLGRGIMGKIGQDIVINPGDAIYLVNTGDVALSCAKGELFTFSNNGGSTGVGASGTFIAPVATLTIEETDTIGEDIRSALTGPNVKVEPVSTTGDF
jgi:hypothetical protein